MSHLRVITLSRSVSLTERLRLVILWVIRSLLRTAVRYSGHEGRSAVRLCPIKVFPYWLYLRVIDIRCRAWVDPKRSRLVTVLLLLVVLWQPSHQEVGASDQWCEPGAAGECVIPSFSVDSRLGLGGRLTVDLDGNYLMSTAPVPDGAGGFWILVGQHMPNDANEVAVYKVDATGQLVPDFNASGVRKLPLPTGSRLIGLNGAADHQQRLVVGITVFRMDTPSRYFDIFLRILETGEPDENFGSAGMVASAIVHRAGETYRIPGLVHNLFISSLQIDDDDRIVVVGTLTSLARDYPRTSLFVARITYSGEIDTTFAEQGLYRDFERATPVFGEARHHWLLLANVKGSQRLIVAATVMGRTQQAGDDVALISLTIEGRRDVAFGEAGVIRIDFEGGEEWATGVVLTAPDRIAVTGVSLTGTQRPSGGFGLAGERRYRQFVAALDTTGAFVPSFGNYGRLLSSAALETIPRIATISGPMTESSRGVVGIQSVPSPSLVVISDDRFLLLDVPSFCPEMFGLANLAVLSVDSQQTHFVGECGHGNEALTIVFLALILRE